MAPELEAGLLEDPLVVEGLRRVGVLPRGALCGPVCRYKNQILQITNVPTEIICATGMPEKVHASGRCISVKKRTSG